MKFMVVSELVGISDDEAAKILGLYAEHGAPDGLEGLWVTADGRQVVQLMELDDLTDFHRVSELYRPAFAGGKTTWYPLVDAETAVAHQAAGIEVRRGAG